MNKTEKFINRASKVHGHRYDYSKTQYENCKLKVVVICPEHGEFYPTPDNHVRGKGCPGCGGTKKMDTQDFISKAVEVHGGTYDYSKSEYKASRYKIEILCKEHGSFWQTANSHLCGRGCPYCRNDLVRNSQRKNTDWFVERSQILHENKYTYNKSLYVSAHKNVVITCPEHGDFSQIANVHMWGGGCPKCARLYRAPSQNSSFGSSGYYGTHNPSNLYIMEMGGKFLKVGLSKDVESRAKTLSKTSGYQVDILHTFPGPANFLWGLEQNILRKSNLKMFDPEVSFAGSTECLETEELPKILEIIEDYI